MYEVILRTDTSEQMKQLADLLFDSGYAPYKAVEVNSVGVSIPDEDVTLSSYQRIGE